jgi:hypothetical protein
VSRHALAQFRIRVSWYIECEFLFIHILQEGLSVQEKAAEEEAEAGTQFTCFSGTKVQILTQLRRQKRKRLQRTRDKVSKRRSLDDK